MPQYQDKLIHLMLIVVLRKTPADGKLIFRVLSTFKECKFSSILNSSSNENFLIYFSYRTGEEVTQQETDGPITDHNNNPETFFLLVDSRKGNPEEQTILQSGFRNEPILNQECFHFYASMSVSSSTRYNTINEIQTLKSFYYRMGLESIL